MFQKPSLDLGAVNEIQNFFIASFSGSVLSDYNVQIETSQKISLTNGVISGFTFKMNDEVCFNNKKLTFSDESLIFNTFS